MFFFDIFPTIQWFLTHFWSLVAVVVSWPKFVWSKAQRQVFQNLSQSEVNGVFIFFYFYFLVFFSEKSGIVIVGSQRKSLVTPTTRVICRIHHIRKSDIHWVWPPRMRIPRDHQDDAFLGLGIPKLVVWVDVSPFPSEYFQVPAVVFGGAIHESIVFSRFYQVITLVLPHIEKRCTKHLLKLDLKTSLSQKNFRLLSCKISFLDLFR